MQDNFFQIFESKFIKRKRQVSGVDRRVESKLTKLSSKKIIVQRIPIYLLVKWKINLDSRVVLKFMFFLKVAKQSATT